MADSETRATQDAREAGVDSVLLIDGDNDPHFPPDFPITPRTVVRVFVRTGAKMPRGLEKRLAELPHCVAVVSPKGGANAADFVMSLHAGILHATLPMHIPFMMVTHDKSLAVMAQELQRVGRRAELWTSHPERGGRRSAPAASRTPSARPASRGRGRGRRQPVKPSPEPVRTPAAAPMAQGRGVSEVAAAYAARLSRIKDPPSRLKTLLNDIKNRAAASGFSAEDILAELKNSRVLSVDEHGRVVLSGR
ncbi:MAG: hypothetical protein HY077_11045 [Elusimicrobia bacterium]|nr:hypothetical protein [Elusimicrobiota bacterium]